MNYPPRVLLMNPIEEGQDFVVDVDPVVSRHTGGKSKIGTFFPLGMTYVAAILRENNIPVKILDPVLEGYTFESALTYALDFDVIIITLAASNAQGTYRFFSRLPDKIKIFMGTHAAAQHEFILEKGCCDIIIRGEPEFSVLETIQNLDHLELVKGISFKNENGVVKNSDRPLNEKLDELPLPARDLVDNSKYRLVSFPGQPTAMILTSRGCPFKCTYCATHLFYKHRRNVRSPESVVEELEHIVTTYNIRNIFFADDTFNIKESRVVEICNLMRDKNLSINWLCLCRVDTMTEPMIKAMAEAGCKEILYGIESASPEVLLQTQKNITPEQMERSVSLTINAGIRVSAFFMFGNPGDTLESIRSTSALARKLNPTFASFNIATPDPGTELYESLKERLQNETFEKFDRLNTDFSLCDVPATQLRRELVKAYLRFYCRPSFWFSLIKFIANDPLNAPSMIKIFCRQAKNVLL